jgi:LPXTG-motif cell wall-anchored protein
VIFWLAHGYAHILAAGVVDREPITGASVREALIRELPLVLGALLPALVLLATPLGLLSEEHSDSLALLVGVALLTAFGFVAARRRRAGFLGTVILTAISAGLGLVMVGLKSAVH